MSKIKINLIPAEVVVQEKDLERRRLSIRISIAIVVLFTTITLVSLAIYLTQKININSSNKQLTDIENQVKSLKDQEGVVSFLKQRIDSIASINSKNSGQEQSYLNSINLVPTNVHLS